MKKRNFKIAVAVACVVAFGLNIQWAIDGYGIKKGMVQIALIAAETGTGTGSGSSSGSASGSGTGIDCPLPEFVQDERIVTSKVRQVQMWSNMDGCITVGGVERCTFSPNWVYYLDLQLFECEQKYGNCCEQKWIGYQW